MRQLAFFTLISLGLSFACTTERIPPTRPPAPGILKGRMDTLEQQYFIKRYVGQLGADTEIPLDLLLVNWGNGRLTGQTYYPEHEGVLQFEGVLHDDQSFELVEQRFDKRNASFSGQFSGTNQLSGTWWNIDSSASLPFDYQEVTTPYDFDLWTGAWHLNDPWDTATLIIGGVTEYQLQFAMNIYINGYREMFYGTADIRGNTATMDLELFRMYRENCKVTFTRKDRAVHLNQESFPFLCGLGPNCWPTGTYHDIYSGNPARIDYIGSDSVFRDTQTYEAFFDLVGAEGAEKFAYNMERLERHEANDSLDQIYGTFWKGRVRGFHREKEGIILYDDQHIWAATTTPPLESIGPMKVHYFTNHKRWKKRMPRIIKHWMKDFQDCSVVFE